MAKLQLKTESLKDSLHLGLKLQLTGNFVAAETEYRRILKQVPMHTDALQFLAILLQQNNDPASARYFIEKAQKSAPNNTQVLVNQAEIYRAQGELDKVLQCVQKALSIKPDLVDAFVISGDVYQQKKQPQKAIKQFTRALQLNPYDVPVHNELANVLCLSGRFKEALQHYQQALSMQADFHECRINFADTLIELGDINNAITHYQYVLDLQPENTSVLIRLATAYEKIANRDEAVNKCRRAIEINPALIDARIHLGRILLTSDPQQSADYFNSVLEIEPNNANGLYWLGIHAQTMGKFQQATYYFQQAIDVKPDFADAWHRLSLNRGYRPEAEDIKQLEQQCIKTGSEVSDNNDLITLSFTLGRFLDQIGNYKSAFRYYQQGNEWKSTKNHFDRKEHRRQIDDIINTFNMDFFSRRLDWGNQSEVPVFIVGMPRSGTTLLEQILSVHPALHGAGELEILQQYVKSFPNTDSTRSISHAGRTAKLDRQQIEQIAEKYLCELHRIQPEAPGIIDKLPGNYLRIGLIYLLFPNARIIHCKRDPLDTCWSCYQQNFEKGLSFTNNLEDLGYAYCDYLRLMAHWHKVLPGKILDAHYEDLLEDPSTESRRLLQHCGLEWTPAVLDYYQQKRPVSSASLWQVRQPLYKSSVGRWKTYQQYLHPLQQILSTPD